MFFLIYKIAPHKRIRSVIALKATFVATILWEVAKQLFGLYILHLGRFSVLYGSLGTFAIFLLWIYYTSAIFLFGGEIASLLEQEESIPVDQPGTLKDSVAVIWVISVGIGARTFSPFPIF